MAQSYQTDSATLYLPGAYPEIKVQQQQSGLPTTGIIFLVGEAEAGPSFDEESDLSLNFFAPTEMSEVIAKYKSGRLVDAFRAAANPAKDVNITGSPSFIYCIKTNQGAKASLALSRSGLTDYGTLYDKSYGALGNLLYSQVSASQAEVAPETGLLTYIPLPSLGGSDSANVGVRVNGGAKSAITVSARTSPASLAAQFNAVDGLELVGGVDRDILDGVSAPDTLGLVASGNAVTITVSSAWGNAPTVGDTMIIARDTTYGNTADSVIDGAGGENFGAYIVTAVTTNTIQATKLRDDDASGAPTAPATVAPVSLSGTPANDLKCFSPINFKVMTGVDRGMLDVNTVGNDVTGTASGSSLTVVLETGFAWAALPQVGDIVKIPSSAPAGIKGGGSENVGKYVVTAATTGTGAGESSVTMTRISNGDPVSFGATALAAATDIVCLRPVMDGVGKVLELTDNAGSVAAAQQFFETDGTAADILSASGDVLLWTSASEQIVRLNVTRQSDGTAEAITAGGDIVLKIGYKGTTATMTFDGTDLTTTVVGGTGASLTGASALKISQFKTLSDLAQFINSKTGYSCSVGSALYGQLSPTILDYGTFSICSDIAGSQPGRIKRDAQRFFDQVSTNSGTVQLGDPAERADAGLPEAQAISYLAGGTLGATTATQAAAAIDALSKLRGNFVVTLFSRDATDDIADGLTDSASSYEIDAINAAVSSHVLAMSKLKTRRHRQGFVSFRGSFADAKLAAQNIANYRVSMQFQDVKALSSDGSIVQFQPWMASVYAAGMQAAGFYRSLVFKGLDASGALMADGSFTDQDDADLEAAVTNGLMAIERPVTGGIRWNTDQTTYAVDGSFVFNSVQAIYASDTIALTVAQRMENAFVGQSVADVSASVALAYLQGIMADMKRLKLIAGSDDAPLGYRNAQIVISGNAMKVQLEIKLAGAILFIPITFLVTQVQQSASQQ